MNSKLKNKLSWTLVPLFFVACLTLSAAPSENIDRDAEQTIQYYYQQIIATASDNPHDSEFKNIVEGLIDIDRFAPQLVSKEWQKLTTYEQDRFKEAVKVSLSENLKSQFEQYATANPTLELKSKEEKERVATLIYTISGGKRNREITINMLKYPDGLWKLTNIRDGKKNLRQIYYRFCKDILDDYSIANLIAELTGRNYIELESFESGEVGKLPKQWTWRGGDDDKDKPYAIKEEGGNKYLAADDNGESVILGKKIRWNLKKYPYISFRWRGRSLPEGGDERYGPTNDSGAAIYVTYKKKFGLIPVVVKYVWSTTLPVGVATRRSGTGRPWNIVAESGEENLGEWHTYTFNAYEAYKKTFGGNPPDNAIGVGLLSDANSTHSQAYADYDDIRALKQADADSGIKQFMKGGK